MPMMTPNTNLQATEQASGVQGEMQGQDTGMQPDDSVDVGQQEFDPSIIEEMDRHMGSLPEETQRFILDHLTPEITTVIGAIFGQEAFDFLKEYSDPTIMLVPVPREEAEQLVGGQESVEGEQPSAEQPGVGMNPTSQPTQE